MAGKKLLERLLRMKGFCITWFELHERKREVFIGVKPHKTGCRCPHCDRRCKIVNILSEYRVWRDVVICGMQPSVALTLAEMGREMIGVRTALNLDQALEELDQLISSGSEDRSRRREEVASD